MLDNYPEAKLVLHEDERQFNRAEASYSDLHGDGWKFEYGGKYLISGQFQLMEGASGSQSM